MTQKPKIQYVGMFYVHGSEARQLAQRQRRQEARSRLPLQRLKQAEQIYVDPVAIVAIVVALVMLAVMVVGALDLVDDWAEYRQMSGYVSSLKAQNAELTENYRASYDLADIQMKAQALGMVPMEELEQRTVTVSVPQPEPERTRLQELRWYLEYLFCA